MKDLVLALLLAGFILIACDIYAHLSLRSQYLYTSPEQCSYYPYES